MPGECSLYRRLHVITAAEGEAADDGRTREHLDAVAAELNRQPRKTLGWKTPAERLHKLLAA
uniref:hypothetical protein n=1 Tax=Streptomyces sp. NBC_01562 TaxID=2975879 RepID=UPI002F91659E